MPESSFAPLNLCNFFFKFQNSCKIIWWFYLHFADEHLSWRETHQARSMDHVFYILMLLVSFCGVVPLLARTLSHKITGVMSSIPHLYFWLTHSVLALPVMRVLPVGPDWNEPPEKGPRMVGKPPTHFSHCRNLGNSLCGSVVPHSLGGRTSLSWVWYIQDDILAYCTVASWIAWEAGTLVNRSWKIIVQPWWHHYQNYLKYEEIPLSYFSKSQIYNSKWWKYFTFKELGNVIIVPIS
jgi:hypothetical protein